MPSLSPISLAGAIYSAGKVFDGLRTGRLDTEEFLRSGNTAGITSRADLALLEDLRDAAQVAIDYAPHIDADAVLAINAALTRSAALHPGHLRGDSQHIGVSTRYGRHTPPALTADDLNQLVAAVAGTDPIASAKALFVALAKAQPFEDGNKRTALLSATATLLDSPAPQVLVIPTDYADDFNDALARAYLYNEDSGVFSRLNTEPLLD